MMLKNSLLVFLTVLAVGFYSFGDRVAVAGSIDSQLQAKLEKMDMKDSVRVIITLTDQADPSMYADDLLPRRREMINRALRLRAEISQKPLLDYLQRENAREVEAFWIFNGIAATVSAATVPDLAARPDVQSIRLDGAVHVPVQVPAVTGVPEWNLAAINVPALWALGHTGSGIVVATMDSGVDPDHPDLASRWRGGNNSWFDPHGVYSQPHDSDGHGTQVMGVMVGGDAGGTSVGVAPGAAWIAVKIFDDTGQALYSDIHAGFQWLLDPDGNPATNDLPDVVNGSWGYDALVNQCFTEFQPDVQALRSAGVAMIFAAGNSGPAASTSVSPANYPESFAVGSVDETLAVDAASSRGPSACDGTVFPEMVAPGVNIRTTDLTLGGTLPDSYVSVSGTSVAAPHVAGAMAVLLSASPQLGVTDLENALSLSAVDPGPAGPDNDYGNGFLDLAAAYGSFTTYPLTVEVNGRGTVTAYPRGIDCPGDCTGDFIDGTMVTLTAVPESTARFVGWSGACNGHELTCQVTLDQVRNVAAEFYSFPWHLFFPIPAMAHHRF